MFLRNIQKNLTKLIVVTGATSGIGRAVVLNLAKENKVIATARNESKLLELEKLSKNIISAPIDLFCSGHIKRIHDVIPKNSSIFRVVHCAGMLGPIINIEKLEEKGLSETIFVNAIAPTLLTNELKKYFFSKTRVLFIGSDFAKKSLPNYCAYGMSKAALFSAYNSMRQHFYKQNHFFSMLIPGPVKTKIYDSFWKSRKGNTTSDYRKKLPSSPEDIAKFIREVLMNTSVDEFYNTIWDYRNIEQRERFHLSENIITDAPSIRSSL